VTEGRGREKCVVLNISKESPRTPDNAIRVANETNRSCQGWKMQDDCLWKATKYGCKYHKTQCVFSSIYRLTQKDAEVDDNCVIKYCSCIFKARVGWLVGIQWRF